METVNYCPICAIKEDINKLWPNDSTFSRTLKIIMDINGINQAQLARLLDMRQSQISNWVNGKCLPHYRAIQLLKDEINVCVHHYFD
jgi:DNA-binding transcriptional regulator YiaG